MSFPLQIIIGLLTKYTQDRQFILSAFCLLIMGNLLMISYVRMSQIQYIVGTVFITLTSCLTDGVATSLTSKVLPPKFAHSILNVGLLTTIAGSLGRSIGGLYVSVVGVFGDDEELENNMFIPLALLSLALLFIYVIWYKLLTPLLYESKLKINQNRKIS